MDKLFEAVKEAHDGKARPVFLCKDPQGFYVFKPQTGFKTKHWENDTDEALLACFDRQVGCTQNNGFFEPDEAPAVDENYSLKVAPVTLVLEPVTPVLEPVTPVVEPVV